MKKTSNQAPAVADKYLRRAVVQIDPVTFQQVNRFETASAAEKILKIRNVLRACDRCGQAAGFYWAFADEYTEGWQPVKRKKGYQRAAPKKPSVSVKTPTLSDKEKKSTVLSNISDEVLLAEIRKRESWRGTVVNLTTIITETI